jgi:anti-sigma factor (TIGR02949 family)
MDCNEARPLLDANADRELSPPQAREIQQHIDSCDACRRESDMVRALSGAIRTATYHRAPDDLRARILAGLPAVQIDDASERAERIERVERPQAARPASKARAKWFDRWRLPQGGGFGVPAGGALAGWTSGTAWRGGLALALCVLVAAGAALTLTRANDSGPFVDELVSSHVRAQMSGRSIDVISTDQHTVKPWFNGRIDYAPPVEDLAASGFALAGGRLDYVGHRRVAVLTYRHAKHIIDVYVLPADDPAAGKPGPAIIRDGYALARWRDEGMMWWAVTDAAPDTLTALQAALKARLHGGADVAPYSGS